MFAHVSGHHWDETKVPISGLGFSKHSCHDNCNSQQMAHDVKEQSLTTTELKFKQHEFVNRSTVTSGLPKCKTPQPFLPS